MTEETKKVSEESYSLVEVPVQTTLAYKNNKTGEVIDDKQALVQILNKLEQISKHI